MKFGKAVAVLLPLAALTGCDETIPATNVDQAADYVVAHADDAKPPKISCLGTDFVASDLRIGDRQNPHDGGIGNREVIKKNIAGGTACPLESPDGNTLSVPGITLRTKVLGLF